MKNCPHRRAIDEINTTNAAPGPFRSGAEHIRAQKKKRAGQVYVEQLRQVSKGIRQSGTCAPLRIRSVAPPETQAIDVVEPEGLYLSTIALTDVRRDVDVYETCRFNARAALLASFVVMSAT